MIKRLILVAVFAIALSAPVYAGGVWGMIKNATSDGNIKTKQYTVEVAGVNVRAYAFYVPEMDSWCVNMWGEDNQSLVCKTVKEITGTETKKRYED